MKTNHLIDLNALPVKEWDKLIASALAIRENPQSYYGAAEGKILATLFFEPSTRTQMSFQTAMLRLGGRIIGFDNPSGSSVSKGENLNDTIRVVSSYSDILVMRHPLEGSSLAGAISSSCPVINAGDGGHLHPTQTLTDLVTLAAYRGRLTNLKIGLCGDLKNGRTVHSLVRALSLYAGNEFVCISTENLGLPEYLKKEAEENRARISYQSSLEEAIGELDILYMTRIQRERFSSPEEYERERTVYLLDSEKLAHAKEDLMILHPLPRVDEIEMAVDRDPRAMYFDQALCGVYARMALILYMLDSNANCMAGGFGKASETVCPNGRCITNHEKYLPKYAKQKGHALLCSYCETQLEG